MIDTQGAVPTIVLLTTHPTLQKEVEVALAQAGVKAVLSPDQALIHAADFVLIDHRGTDGAALAVALGQAGEKGILLTEQEDKHNINNLLARHPICHIIGTNGRSFVREIVITVGKRVSGDIWGLEKYFDSTEHLVRRSIDSASQIDETIEDMLSHADLRPSFSATHEFLRMTANELSTNAVYNAPVDEQNRPKYEQVDRRNKVHLLDNEQVTISLCYDETYVGISVEDKFGRLDRDKIVRHLVKCVNNTKFIENKKGGAGAGIYLAFYTANQFVINIDPGKRLEAICILEKNKRYKEYRSRVTSFNYFKKIGGAA